MSVIQHGGTQTANLSSNSQVITGSGVANRGVFYSLNTFLASGNVVIYDSQVSTTAGRVIAVNTANPTVGIWYNQGLFVNNSAAVTVVVQYQPFMVQRS
mgnify:FL=1